MMLLHARADLDERLTWLYNQVNLTVDVTDPEKVKLLLGQYANVLAYAHSLEASTEYWAAQWTNRKRTLNESERDQLNIDNLRFKLAKGLVKTIESNSMVLMSLLKNAKLEKVLTAQ